jgi:hypothetical protein
MFLALAVLEILAFTYGGLYGIVASRIWFCLMLLFFFVCVRVVVLRIKADIHSRDFVSLAILFFILAAIFFGCGSSRFRWLTLPGCEQLTAGLNALRSANWGYTDFVKAGYPVRQYVMLAITSFLFGRNMFTLQFPFDFVLALSILIMYSGLKQYFTHHKPYMSPSACLLCLSALICPLLCAYAQMGGQVLLPPAFAMMGIGWLLMFSESQGVSEIIGLSFTGVTLAAMYEPGYAAAILLIAALGRQVILSYRAVGSQRDTEKKSVSPAVSLRLAIMFYIGVSMYFSVRGGVSCGAIGAGGENINIAYGAFMQMLSESPYGLTRMLSLGVAAFGIAALLGVFGFRETQVFIWVGLTVAAALTLHGEGLSRAVALQRVMVVVPIVTTLMGYHAFRLIHKYIRGGLLRFVARTVCCVYVCVCVSLNLVMPIQPANVDESSDIVMTHIALDAIKQSRQPQFGGITPTLVVLGSNGEYDDTYGFMKFLKPDMQVVTSRTEKVLPAAHSLIVYIFGNAALPPQYATSNAQTSAFIWKAGVAQVEVQRILIP